jgi:hypothetical protein
MATDFQLSRDERDQALAVISILESLCKGKTGKKFLVHLKAMRQAMEHRSDARWLASNDRVADA